MNNIIKHIVMVSLALTYVACSDNYEDDLATSGGEGSISFNIALPESASTRSDNVSSALDQSVLKIYDADNRLVRRYEPVTEMPESIYILAGNYTATLLVGDETTATLDWSELSYYGEVGFTVTDEMNSSVTLSCPTQNSLVEVSFDSSIDNVFKEGYQVSIYNAENQEDATKSLTLTTSGTAYFLLDEEETLWWDFSGEKLNDSQESASGKIEGLQATQLYTLSFKYSTYLEVSTMSVVIDDSLETYNDLLLFAPQPQITAITEEYSSEVNKYYTDDIQFSVSSLSEIVRVEVITDDITTAISVGGDEVDGLSYVAEDDE